MEALAMDIAGVSLLVGAVVSAAIGAIVLIR